MNAIEYWIMRFNKDKIFWAVVSVLMVSAFFVVPRVKSYINKPTVNDYNLNTEQEYFVKRISVVDSNSFGVLVNDGLYYVKLNLHVVDTAKRDIAELLNTVDKLGLIVKSTERHIGGNIYVEIIVYKGNARFTLSNWLKEKNLVYRN